ncbi:MAG: hypothetical protein KAX55_17770 [Propionivibrio sp.]|nr:hypothetical protein [Propionivibrio sp.]
MKVGTSTLGEIRTAPAVSAKNETTTDRIAKQLKDWQEARNNVKALSAFKHNPKQAALEKAGMLRQRLEMLKEMLRFATPEMAKALAQELKSIAKELKALGQSVGNNSSTSMISTSGAEAAVPAEALSAASATASAETTANETATEESSDADAAEEGDASTQELGKRTDNAGESADGIDNDSLRKVLRDTGQLLKALIERLKAKLREGDKEAKRDLQAAEKSLADLDKTLSQNSGTGFYTAQGNAGAETIGSFTTVTPTLMGNAVNISV